MNAKSVEESCHFSQKTANSELIETLIASIGRQLEMCKKLEHFADQLPETVDATECLPLANEMLKCLQRAHEFEELILFPVLQELYFEDNQLDRTLERLRFEHVEDECFADELKVCLTEFANDQQANHANLLGYMLRGFFEGVRRHVAFEREHILPMLELQPA